MRFFKDEWLVPTVQQFVGVEKLNELRSVEDRPDTLWEAVVSEGLVSDDQLLATLAERLGLKVADLSQAEKLARSLIPDQVAFRYSIVPLRASEDFLEVATSNPFDLDCEKTLGFATSRQIRMQLASPSAIAKKLKEYYRPENVLEEIIDGIHSTAEITQIEDEDPDELTVSQQEASERPVIRMVDLILSEGIGSRASDIHIEPEREGVAVRYRIDGVLRQVMSIPRSVGLPLISRIKIMSGLDIADRLRPQDGRARVAVNGVPVDLRVSTLPAAGGEKVVIRILDSSATELELSSLGFAPEERTAIEDLLEHRDGVVLVTGPTGSGKTTTLYSAIRYVQSEGVNIVTVEDPVEYRMKGIVQVQVHEKANLTFASALRSILRQDPDVVLVGEVRDRETAQIAVQASLTGHLVLTTLHTNDAAGAVTRLMDIGVEPYKIGTALRGVIAQRLMRQLCQACKQPWTDPLPEHLEPWVGPESKLYRPVGCPECAMTGYRGRFAVVEILRVSGEIEHRISAGQPADRIGEAARTAGMRSLWESGLAHVLAGRSSLDELLRVVGSPQPTEGSDSRRSDAHEAPRAESGKDKDANGNNQATAAPPHPGYPYPGLVERMGVPYFPQVPGYPPMASPLGWPGGPDLLAQKQVDLDFELLEPAHGEEGGNYRVLVVEDEDNLRAVVGHILKADGWQVAEARDGVEALESIDRDAPDVILLDLNLPRRDGFQVLADLRSRPSTATIPIVVLSARQDEDSELRVFSLDADGFVPKPFRSSTLSARLRALVRRRRQSVKSTSG